MFNNNSKLTLFLSPISSPEYIGELKIKWTREPLHLKKFFVFKIQPELCINFKFFKFQTLSQGPLPIFQFPHFLFPRGGAFSYQISLIIRKKRFFIWRCRSNIIRHNFKLPNSKSFFMLIIWSLALVSVMMVLYNNGMNRAVC